MYEMKRNKLIVIDLMTLKYMEQILCSINSLYIYFHHTLWFHFHDRKCFFFFLGFYITLFFFYFTLMPYKNNNKKKIHKTIVLVVVYTQIKFTQCNFKKLCLLSFILFSASLLNQLLENKNSNCCVNNTIICII